LDEIVRFLALDAIAASTDYLGMDTIAASIAQPSTWLAPKSFYTLLSGPSGKQAAQSLHTPFSPIAARVGVVDGPRLLPIWTGFPNCRLAAIDRSRGCGG
jgi:hypothetical protein